MPTNGRGRGKAPTRGKVGAALLRGHRRLVDGLAFLAGGGVVLTMVLVTLDVLLRSALNASLPWVFEVTEYALLYIPCLGMAWLARERGHVSLDLISHYLDPANARRLDAVGATLAAGVCGFVTWWGVSATYDAWVRGIIIYGVLPMPRWALLAVIPIGFGLTSLEYARHAYQGFARSAVA